MALSLLLVIIDLELNSTDQNKFHLIRIFAPRWITLLSKVNLACSKLTEFCYKNNDNRKNID
jgi:hypothetical protein